MFAVEVRDHIMIAHSFPSPTFGPAQGMHGATFTVDAAFFAEEMDHESLVVDIGLATEALAETLEPLRYKNLDEVEELAGKFTTTEVIIEHIAQKLAAGLPAGHGLTALEVEAEEHPRARASVRVQL